MSINWKIANNKETTCYTETTYSYRTKFNENTRIEWVIVHFSPESLGIGKKIYSRFARGNVIWNHILPPGSSWIVSLRVIKLTNILWV
jgi:hypothetical protein